MSFWFTFSIVMLVGLYLMFGRNKASNQVNKDHLDRFDD